MSNWGWRVASPVPRLVLGSTCGFRERRFPEFSWMSPTLTHIKLFSSLDSSMTTIWNLILPTTPSLSAKSSSAVCLSMIMLTPPPWQLGPKTLTSNWWVLLPKLCLQATSPTRDPHRLLLPHSWFLTVSRGATAEPNPDWEDIPRKIFVQHACGTSFNTLAFVRLTRTYHNMFFQHVYLVCYTCAIHMVFSFIPLFPATASGVIAHNRSTRSYLFFPHVCIAVCSTRSFLWLLASPFLIAGAFSSLRMLSLYDNSASLSRRGEGVRLCGGNYTVVLCSRTQSFASSPSWTTDISTTPP